MFHLEGNEAPKGSMPACLNKLPADEKLSLSQALNELANAGLTEVKNISEIKDILVDKLGMRNQVGPKESFLSDYAKMSLWCWTPSKWKTAYEAAGLPVKTASPEWETRESRQEDIDAWTTRMKTAQKAAGKLGLTRQNPDETDESNFEFSMEVGESDDEKKAAEKRAKSEKFTAFWKAQVKAHLEIESCVTQNLKPEPGDGFQPLFYVMESGWSAPAKPERKQIEWEANTGLTSNSRSVVMVHLGSGGCELGGAAWERILKDQGLSEGKEGSPLDKDGLRGDPRVHFYETGKGQLASRAIFLRSGNPATEYGKYGVSPVDIVEREINGENVFGGGYNVSGEEVWDTFRRQFEMADKMDSLIVTNSLDEDFDAGYATSLMKTMREENRKKPIWTVTTTPGLNASPMQAWAGICGMNNLIENATASILVDLAQLRVVATRKTQGLGLPEPANSDLIGLTQSIIPSLTAGLIFQAANSAGTLPSGPGKLATNLVPYPRLHFLAPQIAPILGPSLAPFGFPGSNDTLAYQGLFKGGLSSALSLPGNEARVMAVSASFRGMQYIEACQAVEKLKRNREFICVDWSPTGFHMCGPNNTIGNQEPEIVSLHNTSAFGTLFADWIQSVDDNASELAEAASRNYEGGFSGDAFQEAKEDLQRLTNDYKEATSYTEEDEEEEEDY